MMLHATDLALRKLFAGEPVAPELKAHSESCEQCKAKLKAIEDEQNRFEAAIPFERFAAGVERAARTPRHVAPPPPRRQWVAYAMGIAATVLVVATASIVLKNEGSANRLKGSDTVDVIVAGPANGPQRAASHQVAEALAPGERVQIAWDAKSPRYLVAVSIDERGEVSAIPDQGQSMPITGKGQLPHSIEFTGRGTEHVVVVLTRDPLQVDEVRRALKQRYEEARGNLGQLGQLDVAGEQHHYTFLKP